MNVKTNKGNRLIAAFIALLLVLQVFMPSVVYAAQDMEAPQMTSFDLSFNDDGTANIKSYKHSNNSNYTSVVIPSNINGIEITGISDRAFYRAGYLKSIRIPDTIKSLGNYSFYQCSDLKEITIPGSVSAIGNNAFMGCRSLERVFILFGVQSIGNGAFANCTNLSQVSISPSTASINVRSFNNSGSVEIQANPDSPAGQYKDYQNMVTVVDLPSDSPSAYEYTVDKNTGEVIIEGYVGTSKTPIVPDKINGMDVSGIGDGAFQDKPITQVTLPDTLRTIGSNAFAGTMLTVVEIPSTVTGIGEGAFNDDAGVTLKGDSNAIDEYLQNSKFIKFIPWGPGRTKYHQVTFKSSPSLGGVIVKGRTKEYKEGKDIEIEAKPTTPANIGSADKGKYLFKGWTVTSNTTDNTSIDSIIENKNLSKTFIKMPAYAITVTANYELVPPNPLVIKNGVVLSYIGDGTNQLVISPEWREEENQALQTVHTVGSSGINGGVVFLDTNMEKLNLPYTITNINSRAFNNASGLKEIVVAEDNPYFETEEGVLYNKGKTKLLAYPQNKITENNTFRIPDSVTEIGDYAFYNNRNLESIDLNKVTKIGSYAFSGCRKIEYVMLPETLSYLGDHAFYNCSLLSFISWGEVSQIKSIPAYAFAKTALESAKLPNGAEEVCDYAFAYCNNLNAVTLSRTVKKWSSSALFGCYNINIIEVEDENQNYSSLDGVLFDKNKTVLLTYPAGKEGDSYTIPESVNKIAGGAFGYSKFKTIDVANVTVIGSEAFANSNIQSINLEKMTEINYEAFYNCNGLTAVTWPSKINIIPSEIFRYCKNLETVIIPETVTSINNNAFSNCTSLKNIVLPSSLETIGSYAFYNCSSIEQIDLADKLTNIGYAAFSGCSGLTTVTVPENVTSLGDYVFANCSGLKTVNVQYGNIPDYAFSNCTSLTDLTLSEKIESIGDSAFGYCTKLADVMLPASLKSIGDYAFNNCVSLGSITVGADIGKSAFNNCSALENLTLLDTVEKIGTVAFSGCNKLKSVYIPASISEIGDFAFNYCEALESITVDEENTVYSSDNGILFNKDKSRLISYPQNKEGTSYTVIDTVISVSDCAFESANNLTDVDFTENVSDLGLSVFKNAPNIKQITVRNRNASFASTTTYPARSFFYGISDSIMKNLVVRGYMGSTTEDEVFVHRIKGIKFMALDTATKGLIIQKITKNSSQRTVDNLPLGDKTWLGKVVGYEVPSDLSGTEEAKNIVVPSLVTNEMEGLIIKDESGNVVTLDDGERIVVSAVDTHALWYPGTVSPDEGPVLNSFVKSIKSVSLPQTITDIETNAFEDCTGLNNINIPVSVQNIHYHAFKNCSALTEVTIPQNVVMLGEDRLKDEMSDTQTYISAFVGCVNLKKINVEKGNTTYASVDGVLMNYDKDKIYEVPNGYTGNVDGEVGKYVVPEGVESIGSNAFVGCKLNSIEFSGTVNHIGIGAFKDVLVADSGNNADSKITFADNIQDMDIDNEAFAGCTGLTEVRLPSNLDRLGDDVFTGCTSLQNLTVSDNTKYCTVDGVLFGRTDTESGNTDSYSLIVYPGGRTDISYVVPNSIPVREVYKSAFQNNNYLEEFSCSNDVQLIRESAFRDCTNLNNVKFGSSMVEIQPLAFKNTALTEVSLPESVSYIGQEAFANCKLLNIVEIYNDEVVIGDDAFINHGNGFVLKGSEGSNAEQYANDNGLTFVKLNNNSRIASYNISVADNISNGSVSLDMNIAEENDTINVTVVPNDGYRLVENSLKYNDTVISFNDGVYSFVMPNEEVTITAEFEPISDEETVYDSSDSNVEQQIADSENDSTVQGSEQSEANLNKDDSVEISDDNVTVTYEDEPISNDEMSADSQDSDTVQEADDSDIQDSEQSETSSDNEE